MDFIHCLMRAPWGFFRNTDDRYGVKVVAEEGPGFLDWQISPEQYQRPRPVSDAQAAGVHGVRGAAPVPCRPR